MRKSIFLFLVFISIASYSLYAQSSQIVATAYKQVFWIDGKWGEWPSYWTSYKSEGRSNPIIRITTINEGSSGDIYRLQMFIEGTVKADFYVAYDPKISTKKRRDWNDKYINCYKDVNGDYVYTQNVSLQSLAKNSSAWANNENAKLYLWVFSQDMAVILR
ncbi:hypothetical protein [Aquimarina megaterium]|uniref:hypothetical protein n=1 Tax=Aquimarina megaterium TaxID=1443666 RepID=UPI0004722C48|nr:hypothetical protein [Aquimarina megaterium]